MRAALPWLWASCLSLSLAACGISKPVGLTDAGTADGDGGAEVSESECVKVAVELPWPAGADSRVHPGLEVVAGRDAIAVLNRQAALLDVRTYGLDGAVLGAGSFASDTQVLAASGDGFTVVTRTDDGADLVEATIDSTLKAGSAELAVSATDTERVMAAVRLPTTTMLITDERVINLATGTSAAWTAALDAPAAETFKTGRVFGVAAQADKVLLAWGAHGTLGLVVVDTSAHVVAQALDDKFLGELGTETANAMPVADGLLLFDGNPVRTTEIDFALTRHALDRNQQLRASSLTVPRVAGVMLGDRAVAFWLSFFPLSDSRVSPHQLYGCALDLAASKTCASTALIAMTDLSTYVIADQAVAAAALPDGASFAIVHTDSANRTWLRIADLSCERPR